MDNTESSLIEIIEEEDQEEKKKEIIEQLLKQVPYSLSVALIKISQLNNYVPLSLDKYYDNILPAFELLRRTDGSKYKIHSKNVVRSAMVSNKIYTRNMNNLYEINLTNAINFLQMIKQKKSSKENSLEKSYIRNYDISHNQNDEEYLNTNITIDLRHSNSNSRSNSIHEYIGKKRNHSEKNKKEGVKNLINKYIKIYILLKELLEIANKDKVLYSQINFDFSNLNETNLDNRKISIDKIIGMLIVFKFYKEFLEKCFNIIRLQDNLKNKISELYSEANYIENIFKNEE